MLDKVGWDLNLQCRLGVVILGDLCHDAVVQADTVALGTKHHEIYLPALHRLVPMVILSLYGVRFAWCPNCVCTRARDDDFASNEDRTLEQEACQSSNVLEGIRDHDAGRDGQAWCLMDERPIENECRETKGVRVKEERS